MGRLRVTNLAATLALAIGAPAAAAPGDLEAQAVTTASVGGTVTDERGQGVESAEIRVIQRATGLVARGVSHADGRFLVQGLPAGGPYAVVVRRIGYRDVEQEGVALALGQYLRLDATLAALPAELEPLTVQGEPPSIFSPTQTGAATTISDAWLHRLPTANQEVFGFLRLVPQMSTAYGPSGGGVNYRFNGVQLDGALDQAVFGGNVPGAIWGSRSIAIDAVQEYQVLLSPYDVRHGDFAGALINGVTRSGSNQLHGTAFVYTRNEQLARDVASLRAAPYDRALFGFTVGGPVVRDRAHFFLSAEFQRLHAPATGPYVGQDPTSPLPVPVTAAEVDSFAQILRSHGLDAGSGGPVTVAVPTADLFGRLDVSLPRQNSRLMMRYEYSQSDSTGFSRPIARARTALCAVDSCFPLSEAQRSFSVARHSVAAQLSTQLRGGAYNEFHLAYFTQAGPIKPRIPQPHIQVTVPHASGVGTATLMAGVSDNTQSFALEQGILEASDNVTVPLGSHLLTVGALAQVWHARQLQLPGSYGVWQFASLDSLRQGTAFNYRVSVDRGSADASAQGAMLGLFAGDKWQLRERLTLTFGLRLDVPAMSGAPPYSPQVDSAFGRRTDVVPSGNALWSPRLGFNWDLGGRRREQLRGGVGLFAGRPPLAWMFQPFQAYGSGVANLVCTGANAPPPFPAMPDYRNPPLACANGVGPTALGPVNLVDKGLRFPQTLRASLALDRDLPGDVVVTLEGLYSRATHDFVFLNGNLKGPVGTDRDGRTMYGSLDSATGVATPNRKSQQFGNVDVTELHNQARNYAFSMTVQIGTRFGERAEARAAYTWSRARDVQTHYLPNTISAGEEWRAQPYSGLQEDQQLEISGFDQPHRVVLVGAVTMPWRRWPTDLSVYYVGASGTPFTYVATGSGGRGDLNADGASANDPIYVPRNAADPNEILISATSATDQNAQQAALDRFIAGADCLEHQRGRIMARNSCRSPWVHTLNASVRQALPSVRGHVLMVQVEIFNLLNLLNGAWGAVNLPYPAAGPTSTANLLTQVSQSGGRPVFRFDPAMPRWNSENSDSYYQIQLSARYRF